MASSDERLEAARGYLERGWAVVSGHWVTDATARVLRCSCRQVRCAAQGAHPNVRWQGYADRLPKSAKLNEWWQRAPDANVLVVLGATSKLVVLTVAAEHCDDEAWAKLTAAHGIPETLTATTPSGGRHLYFAHPGERVPSAANVFDGVSVLGDSALVVAPPSMGYRYDGTQWVDAPYRWLNPDAKIAPLPTSINERLGRNDFYAEQPSQPLSVEDLLNDPDARIEGEARAEAMTAIAVHYAEQDLSADEVERNCLGANFQRMRPALDAAEVAEIVAAVMQMEGEKRRGRELAEQMVENAHSGPVERDEALLAAAAIWATVGVSNVTDWLMLRGTDNEFVLVTADEELSLGHNLLSYSRLREALFSELVVLLDDSKEARAQWPKQALALRRLVREQVVEETRAAARIDIWLQGFINQTPPVELDPMDRAKALDQRPILYRARSTGGLYVHLRPKTFHQYIRWAELDNVIKRTDLIKLLLRAGWTNVVVNTLNAKGIDSSTRAMRAPDPYER